MLNSQTLKRIVLTVLLLSLTIPALAQEPVSGQDVGRNIMRLARQKNTGQTPQSPQKQQAQLPKKLDKELLGITSSEIARMTIPISPAIATTATTTAATSTDELLNLMPADSLFCVRINNLDQTLALTDLFLADAAPLPPGVNLAMIIQGQLATILADPVLTNVNMQGSFAFFAVAQKPTDLDAAKPQLLMAFLLPVTNYDKFIAENPNCSTSGLDGIAIISAPDSPIGDLAMVPATGNKFAIITVAGAKDSLPAIKIAMAKSKLAANLDAEQTKQAQSSPLWAYANISVLNQTFGKTVLDQLEQVEQVLAEMPEQPGMTMEPEKMIKMYTDLYKLFTEQAKAVTLNLTPSPEVLSLAITLAAKPDTDLAGFLAKNPKAENNFTLTGYLDQPAAVNVLAKVNRATFPAMNMRFMELFMDIASDSFGPEKRQKWTKVMADSFDATGDEIAFTFSFASGTPPIAIKEIIQLRDEQKYRDAMKQTLEMINDLFTSMGLPMTFTYQANTSQYNGVAIDTAMIKFNTPQDADDPGAQMVNTMYGDGFEYKMAITNNFLLLEIGPDAETKLKALIDKVKTSTPGQPTNDITVALATIPNADKTDFIASVNILRLISGVGNMLQTMPIPGAKMMAPMFSQLDTQTQSCIAMAGVVGNSKATLHIALPKQHLKETINAFMQMQQKMMQQMMQQQPNFWTCPMHPQIKMPQSGKCPLCNMDLVPAAPTGPTAVPQPVQPPN
jgi:hypothetical protein